MSTLTTALSEDYLALNARLNLYGADGKIQFEADKMAAQSYFLNHVNENMRFFHDLRERIDFLVEHGYYEAAFLAKYDWDFVEALHKRAYDKRFRFATFFGAYKFYKSYALRENDGKRYLERYEDRVVVTALYLADGDTALATALVEEILSLRLQPATPTFQNAGRARRGDLVSCFLLRVEDSMDSIARAWTNAAQLSKRGGGVAFNFSNLRAAGDPLKGMDGLAKGILPWLKIMEDVFSGVDQLGQRPGAGAVYLSAHHPDILTFLDTKRENADEKVRIKTLSLGVVIPDITMRLAAADEWLYTFSPYDVQKVYGVPFGDLDITAEYRAMLDNPRIRKHKTIKARDFFTLIAETQFESGYPYLLFEDNANDASPIRGRINMSNLCSEILQVNTASEMAEDGSFAEVGQDISCNLASLNVAKVMQSPDFGATIETGIRALTAVSLMTDMKSVPSVRRGNEAGHAIGLGQMNLAGYLASVGIHYGDPVDPTRGATPEAVDFTSVYFAAVAFHALRASNLLAVEHGKTFDGFADSKYADGSFFDMYLAEDFLPTTPKVEVLFADAGIALPTRQDWADLKAAVMRDGLFNRNLQAIPPTGSISYINNSTASVHPITAQIEIRKEGKTGRTYYPAYGLTDDNKEFYRDAYEVGPYALIDVYAAAQRHIDQGMSCTLFFSESATTRDVNLAQMYAWSKGLKTLYYVRVRQEALAGTDTEGCVSCAL